MKDDKNLSPERLYTGNLPNQQLCELILDSVSDIVGIADVHHYVKYISPSLERILGYKPADILNTKGEDFAYFEDLPAIEHASEQLLKTKETVFEYRCRHKDGHYIWMENKMQLKCDDMTGEIFTIFVIRDISHRKAVEANLAISEKRYQTIANSPLVGISITSRDGKWLSVNEWLCDLLGYSRKELLKLTWQDLTPKPELKIEMERYLKDLDNKTTGQVYEKRYIRKDGGIVNIAVSSMSMYNNQGEIEGFINLITDITDRVRAFDELSEIHRQLNNLLGKLSGMAYRGKNDSHLTMIFLSNGCLELTEYTPEEIVKKHITDYESITHPDDRDWIRKVINEAIREHKHYQMTYRIITKSGKIKWVWEQGNAVYEDNKLKFLEGFITDVTAAKATEKELSDSAIAMQNLNHMKDKFFSIIAHDLKNPIFAIISLTDFLLSHRDKFDEENLNDIINDIRESAQSSYNLLENLLEWAQTQTGNLESRLERVSLQKLIAECISWVDNQAATKNIEIKLLTMEKITVQADYRMLSTTLRNILSNAIKFTHKNGSVEINLENTAIYTKIYIKDNGIGISREQKEQIFRIDKRNANNGTENEPGSGLGLILSKELIEKHNGTITVESKLGKGSTFIISLPQLSE